MTTQILTERMQCKRHPRLLPIPAGCVIENGTYVRPAGTRAYEDRLLCAAPAPEGSPQDAAGMPCSFYMKAAVIVGRVDPTVSCDNRCKTAHGTTCRCACGGRKHGAED